jgi:hypothetical protein
MKLLTGVSSIEVSFNAAVSAGTANSGGEITGILNLKGSQM